MTDPIDNVTEMLFERGVLVDLHIGRPTFQRKLRQSDLLIEGLDEHVLYLGHKKLLPKEALEKLITLDGKARTALADKSLAFPISGARFVRRETLSDVLRSLHEVRVEWQAAITALVTQYPEFKTKQLEQLRKQAEKLVATELQKYQAGTDVYVEKAAQLGLWLEQQGAANLAMYPPAEELFGLFPLHWRMFKVQAAGVSEMDEVAHEQFKMAQEQLKGDLRKWVKQAGAEMHKALGEAALNAKNLLEKNGKLDPRSLRPLFNAFETFNAVDFTGTSDFHTVIEQIKQRFGVRNLAGNMDYEQTSAAVQGSVESFKELLTSVSNLAEEEIAAKAGMVALSKAGEFSRVIEL